MLLLHLSDIHFSTNDIEKPTIKTVGFAEI